MFAQWLAPSIIFLPRWNIIRLFSWMPRIKSRISLTYVSVRVNPISHSPSKNFDVRVCVHDPLCKIMFSLESVYRTIPHYYYPIQTIYDNLLVVLTKMFHKQKFRLFISKMVFTWIFEFIVVPFVGLRDVLRVVL